MIDNAPYHRSKATREFLENLSIPVLFLGPYQFNMAPVEKLFAYLKNRDMNPLMQKSFTKYVDA
jgi:transposase